MLAERVYVKLFERHFTSNCFAPMICVIPLVWAKPTRASAASSASSTRLTGGSTGFKLTIIETALASSRFAART